MASLRIVISSPIYSFAETDVFRKYQDIMKFPRAGLSFHELVSHAPDAEDVPGP
jgi:hypothetical protein